MVRGVAFDLDHTLYDRDATYEKMLPSFMSYFSGYLRDDISSDEILKTIERCDRTGIYKAGHWEGIYCDTLKSGIFRKNPTYEYYYEGFIVPAYPVSIVLYKDTISTINQLKSRGLKVTILTNGPSAYQRSKIEQVSLDRYVDGIIVGEELPYQKPHLTAFQSICKLMECDVSEAAYVGDHPINDVDGARKAGMMSIWFRSVDIWIDSVDPPEYSASQLMDVPAIIERLNQSGK